MVRELRHLGLEGGADEQRRRAGQYDHPDDPRLGADLGQHAARLRQAQAWSPSRLVALAPMAGVRHPEEVERERQVQQHVDEERHARVEHEHERTADRRADEHGEVAADRVEPDRAGEMLGADDVVHDELDRRRRDDARHPVQHQERGRVPGPQRARQEQHAPGQRHQHQQPLGDLDQLAAVEAIGQRARVHREDQVGHPVAEDGEAAEGRRVERLEDDPVAAHVLDALGRQADERQEKVAAVVAMVQRSELRGRGGSGAHSAIV